MPSQLQHDPAKARHHEVIKAADETLSKASEGAKEIKARLRRALAVYEERRRAV